MSFRINVVTEADRATVELAGKLDAEAADELLRVAKLHRSAVVLDLREVTLVDAIAASALKTLRDQGAELVGASPYVTLLLDA